MENKRNQCRKCGGKGEPSKGYMNFHNIQTSDLSKEFETKLLDCIKCTSCGHSWIPTTDVDLADLPLDSFSGKPIQKTTRELAIEWWNNLSEETRNLITKQTRLACDASLIGVGLTGREIEQIWRKENFDNEGNPQRGITITKSNQKQFKEFNPELFRAYINKFSDEDKIRCVEILFNSFVKNYWEVSFDGRSISKFMKPRN
jgi:hypothetical protein